MQLRKVNTMVKPTETLKSIIIQKEIISALKDCILHMEYLDTKYKKVTTKNVITRGLEALRNAGEL